MCSQLEFSAKTCFTVFLNVCTNTTMLQSSYSMANVTTCNSIAVQVCVWVDHAITATVCWRWSCVRSNHAHQRQLRQCSDCMCVCVCLVQPSFFRPFIIALTIAVAQVNSPTQIHGALLLLLSPIPGGMVSHSWSQSWHWIWPCLTC